MLTSLRSNARSPQAASSVAFELGTVEGAPASTGCSCTASSGIGYRARIDDRHYMLMLSAVVVGVRGDCSAGLSLCLSHHCS